MCRQSGSEIWSVNIMEGNRYYSPKIMQKMRQED